MLLLKYLLSVFIICFFLYFCEVQGALKFSTRVQCRKKLLLAEKVDAVRHVPTTPGSIFAWKCCKKQGC